jgi:hypothetical protein
MNSPSGYSKESSTPTPIESRSISNELQKNKDIFYGEWAVTKWLAFPAVSEYNKDNVKVLYGDKIKYSANTVISGEKTLDNPVYKITNIDKVSFRVTYKTFFQDLDINEDSMTRIQVYTDNTSNLLWEEIGNTVFIKDKDTLILWNGVFLEMKRVAQTSEVQTPKIQATPIQNTITTKESEINKQKTLISIDEAKEIVEEFCKKPNIGASANHNKKFDILQNTNTYYFFNIDYGTLMGAKPTEKDNVITRLFINNNDKSIYEAIQKDGGDSYLLGKRLK